MHLTSIPMLLAAAIAPLQTPLHLVTTHFASAPRTCAVLQAAYTAASKGQTPIYPRDVRSDTRVLRLDEFVPEYRAKLALSAAEFAGLTARQAQSDFPHFRPACAWKGDPGPAVDDEGHATFVTFTSPIFSANRKLAMVEVSFREEGTFAYGLICVVRQGRGGWAAQCRGSWIT
ncbi:hypothetical protein [Sphingomonas aracearum]|uniref:Uncharacterized protein n=1 Tax=Sphingomonas aracearum TaxID=2283317 RepID=A0A369W1D4_9SPHN|nr:hypothetical protein [Sphingomonas aracearum]RDE07082.1 hypothetical protein DVW87_05345 [Sphingomonas aracearum]